MTATIHVVQLLLKNCGKTNENEVNSLTVFRSTQVANVHIALQTSVSGGDTPVIQPIMESKLAETNAHKHE